MNNTYISKANIEIHASEDEVWQALVTPAAAKKYFFGALVESDWQEGSTITFSGEYNGNKYIEKGILLKVSPGVHLQYTHWSDLEGIPDVPENYRVWSFQLFKKEGKTQLSVSEDRIPTEKQQRRSDEFWNDVLQHIKKIVEE